MIEVRKKEGESTSAFLYRFTKKIQRAGVVKEAKKIRFKNRNKNERAKKESTMFRLRKKIEMDKLRKLGRA